MLKRICKGSFAAALIVLFSLVPAITSVTPVLAYEDEYESNANIHHRG